jgi:hypothetical protein
LELSGAVGNEMIRSHVKMPTIYLNLARVSAAPLVIRLFVLACTALAISHWLCFGPSLIAWGILAVAAIPLLSYLAYEHDGSSPKTEPYGSFHLALKAAVLKLNG